MILHLGFENGVNIIFFQVEQDLLKISSERQRLEAKNKKDEAKVMQMVRDVMEARARHDQLQKDHNRVLMQQVKKTELKIKTTECFTDLSKLVFPIVVWF